MCLLIYMAKPKLFITLTPKLAFSDFPIFSINGVTFLIVTQTRNFMVVIDLTLCLHHMQTISGSVLQPEPFNAHHSLSKTWFYCDREKKRITLF